MSLVGQDEGSRAGRGIRPVTSLLLSYSVQLNSSCQFEDFTLIMFKSWSRRL